MALSFELFAAADDAEKARYQILAALGTVRDDFRRTRLYPHLGDLVRLRRSLAGLVEERDALLGEQRGPLTGIDLENGKLVYAAPEGDKLPFEELIAWGLPLLEGLIEEGRALYDFVEEHAAVDVVGIASAYQAEGFLLVPEDAGFSVRRYTVSLFTRAGERYRSIRTTPPVHLRADTAVEARRHLPDAIPEAADWPNPATYVVRSDVDLPVEETLLPVAKRKLLHALASRGPMGHA